MGIGGEKAVEGRAECQQSPILIGVKALLKSICQGAIALSQLPGLLIATVGICEEVAGAFLLVRVAVE